MRPGLCRRTLGFDSTLIIPLTSEGIRFTATGVFSVERLKGYALQRPGFSSRRTEGIRLTATREQNYRQGRENLHTTRISIHDIPSLPRRTD
jgi:hypothetical protein